MTSWIIKMTGAYHFSSVVCGLCGVIMCFLASKMGTPPFASPSPHYLLAKTQACTTDISSQESFGWESTCTCLLPHVAQGLYRPCVALLKAHWVVAVDSRMEMDEMGKGVEETWTSYSWRTRPRWTVSSLGQNHQILLQLLDLLATLAFETRAKQAWRLTRKLFVWDNTLPWLYQSCHSE